MAASTTGSVALFVGALALASTACGHASDEASGDATSEGVSADDDGGPASVSASASGSASAASADDDGSTGGAEVADDAADDNGLDTSVSASASSDGDGSSTGAPEDVPHNAYCDAVATWSDEWAMLELELLALVNEARAQGGDCGAGGSFGAAPPLAMQPALRCAARAHSLDMNERGFFDHVNPDGLGPPDRFDEAGYPWSTWGENIATGQPTAAEAMAWWMNSPPHCANILSPDFAEIGVGYHPGGQYGHLWTQTFGRQ